METPISHQQLESPLIRFDRPSTPQAAPFQTSFTDLGDVRPAPQRCWHSEVDHRPLPGSPLGDIDGTQGHHGT